MSEFVKPQSPLYSKENDAYFYPLTTVDQVVMEDGTRLNTKIDEISNITPESIGALSMELVWENASPMSNFAAQTIALGVINGDRITINFEASTINNMPYSVDIDISNTVVTHTAFHVRFVDEDGTSSFYMVTRPFTVNFENGTIAFGEGQQLVNRGGANAIEASRNDRAIPISVYVTKGVSA